VSGTTSPFNLLRQAAGVEIALNPKGARDGQGVVGAGVRNASLVPQRARAVFHESLVIEYGKIRVPLSHAAKIA
jgi:hypothetical protein